MSMIQLVRYRNPDEDEAHISLDGPSPECHNWVQTVRRPPDYAIPIFQGFISDDHMDEHPVYFKRNSVLHLALFVPWEAFLSKRQGDITNIWSDYEAALSPRLRFHVSNISLLRKSAEDARKDAKLWASRSEGDDTVDVELPLDEDYCGEEAATMAEHHQSYTALLQTLQNAIRDSDATRDSPVLRSLARDLCEENPAEEDRSFIQRHEGFYQQIRRNQDSPLCQYPSLSGDDVQAAAKAQNMLHLRMLDEIEGCSQGAVHSTGNADIDDVLARHYDAEIPFPAQGQDSAMDMPRILVDVSSTTGFVELGRLAASNYTLNYLQSMALQLVCSFLDKYTADPDSAGQHLQYTGG
ncbi:hypothetical protein B0J13DRAFT_490134, partial [Dactylonectria estremocensis]